MVVKEELKNLGFPVLTLDLGRVETFRDLDNDEIQLFALALLKSGLELLDDKKAILIEKIKNIIIEMIHYSDTLPDIKYSVYLSEKMGLDYVYLSNTFSEVHGTTIEHFIIAHKIEKVKELLLYDELNLTEISYKLNYSSVAHLSNQFKKMTGLTPTYFKQLKEHRKRVSLEDI